MTTWIGDGDSKGEEEDGDDGNADDGSDSGGDDDDDEGGGGGGNALDSDHSSREASLDEARQASTDYSLNASVP